MNRFRPAETVVNGIRRCGIYVDVNAEGETHEVIEMRLEDSEAARILSPDGEGLYIADGDITHSLTVLGIAAKLACDQCADCPSKDYSIETDVVPVRIDEADVPALEAMYAQIVLDNSNARLMASYCLVTQLF